MNMRNIFYTFRQLFVSGRVAFLFALFMFSPALAQIPSGLKDTLDNATSAIIHDLGNVDKQLHDVANNIALTGINTSPARKILNGALGVESRALNCAILDSTGRMILIEPRDYKGFESRDISAQAHVKELLATKKPVFSQVFRSVEGVDAVAFEYPVLSTQGNLMGAVSLLVKPEIFLDTIIEPVVKNSQVEIWIMQPDGLIVYNQNAPEAGKNVFKDAFYQSFPDFVALCKQIAAQEKGSGSCEFLTRELKNKAINDFAWNTVSINGLQWRVIAKLARLPAGWKDTRTGYGY